MWLREGKSEEFLTLTTNLGIPSRPGELRFPQREVKLLYTNTQALEKVLLNSDAVAELRIAKDTPVFFMGMGPAEQQDWVQDAAGRLQPPTDHAVAVCVLDSGVNRAHPLLTPVLNEQDEHQYEPGWGNGDSNDKGHEWLGWRLIIMATLFPCLPETVL